MPPGGGSFPAGDAHCRDWPLPPSTPDPTTPGNRSSGIRWLARWSSPQPLASLLPIDLVPSRNSAPLALWPGENAPESTRFPVLVTPGRSASAASPPRPSPPQAHPAGASPLVLLRWLKKTRLVRIERHRPVELLQVTPHQLHILLGRIVPHKPGE